MKHRNQGQTNNEVELIYDFLFMFNRNIWFSLGPWRVTSFQNLKDFVTFKVTQDQI